MNRYIYDSNLSDTENTNRLNLFEQQSQIHDLLQELTQLAHAQPKELSIVDLLIKKMEDS